jgi:hypothetical protein
LVAALALAGASGVASGQRAAWQEHRGFWIGFGLGGGVNLSDGFDGDRLGGGTGYVRLGGTPSQRVLLGFEGIGWARDQSGATLGRGNGSFVALFYPSAQGGGFLKGGVGVASISRSTTSGNTTTTTTKAGFGLTVGAGWDVRLGTNLYLTPNLDFLLQALESDTDPVLGDIPGTNTIVMFTLGLVWH